MRSLLGRTVVHEYLVLKHDHVAPPEGWIRQIPIGIENRINLRIEHGRAVAYLWPLQSVRCRAPPLPRRGIWGSHRGGCLRSGLKLRREICKTGPRRSAA